MALCFKTVITNISLGLSLTLLTSCLVHEDGFAPGTLSENDISNISVATGGSHSCSKFDGSVRCWGYGFYGQLGYGNTFTIGDNETPQAAGDVDVGETVTQLAVGDYHTCALLSTGNVRCWGQGFSGQLGYGNTSDIGDDESPASAGDVNVGGTVIQLTAGESHTCALLSNGSVRCWGAGTEGRLGYGNTNSIGDNESPASAGNVDVGGTVTQISAGNRHTCALLSSGNVRCWGAGADGRMGNGDTSNIGDDETPASAGNIIIGGTVTQISAGGHHTCALLSTGNIRCWGRGSAGRLGYGNTSNIGDNESPASAGDVNVGGTVTKVDSGTQQTCALLSTGNVRCWGDSTIAPLGYGNSNTIGDNETPAAAGDLNLGGTVKNISAAYAHICALMSTDQIRCWGAGSDGQLGYGNLFSIGDNEVPATVGDVDVW